MRHRQTDGGGGEIFLLQVAPGQDREAVPDKPDVFAHTEPSTCARVPAPVTLKKAAQRVTLKTLELQLGIADDFKARGQQTPSEFRIFTVSQSLIVVPDCENVTAFLDSSGGDK